MKNSLFVRHFDYLSHKTLGAHDVDIRMRSKGLTANRILRVIFQSNRRVNDHSVNNSFENRRNFFKLWIGAIIASRDESFAKDAWFQQRKRLKRQTARAGRGAKTRNQRGFWLVRYRQGSGDRLPWTQGNAYHKRSTLKDFSLILMT